MATTSWQNPTTAATIDRDGKASWASVERALVSDNQRTYCDVATSTYGDWLRLTGFNLLNLVPHEATIDGIEVEIEGYAGIANKLKDSALYLRTTAGQTSNNGALPDYYDTSETTYFRGGASDTWGTTWAKEHFNSDFGIDISIQNDDTLTRRFNIDCVRIRVHFTATGDTYVDGHSLQLFNRNDGISGHSLNLFYKPRSSGFEFDPRIIEYWRFENNLNAEKSGNTLTASAGGVGYSSSAPLEGAFTLDLEFDNDQFAYRTDTDLSTGFPFKSGDTNKKATFCCWVTPESSGAWRCIWSKTNYFWGGGNNCTHASVDYGTLKIGWGSATSNTDYNTGITLNAGVSYHVAVVINGVYPGSIYVRVYRGDNGTISEHSVGLLDALNICSRPFRVGAFADRDADNTWDGRIDELVVANALLSPYEIDQIRAGTYEYQPGVHGHALQTLLDAPGVHGHALQALLDAPGVHGHALQILYDNYGIKLDRIGTSVVYKVDKVFLSRIGTTVVWSDSINVTVELAEAVQLLASPSSPNLLTGSSVSVDEALQLLSTLNTPSLSLGSTTEVAELQLLSALYNPSFVGTPTGELRVFPVPLPETVWQSQAGKRIFPMKP